MLHGSDGRGTITWLATNLRLVMLSYAEPDGHLATVGHAAITCVELRTDPVGTWLRVRATGQLCTLMQVDAVSASHFCAVLRDRAGLDAGAPPARPPARASLRLHFTDETVHSPR